MRRGDSFVWGDLRITVLRVEEGDPADQFDDEVELSIVTGTHVENVNLRELDSQVVGEYVFRAACRPGGSPATCGA